ncbi:MAG: hypothetical protein FK733_02775 [Asgard group archaeon]|nr:hypothetical protein [Asgard group archaeon]
MKSKTRLIVVLALLAIVSVPFLIPSYTLGWRAEDSEDEGSYYDIDFSTHKWLAWEAVDLFPDSKVTWITENLRAFWLGVEAPYNAGAADEAGLNSSNYGKIHVNESILYLDSTGTTVTNDTLAVYADAEYDKLVIELNKEAVDYADAAFYAGAMSHYISQAGSYGAIWNETLWGTFNRTEWDFYEGIVESGSKIEHFDQPSFYFGFENTNVFANSYFLVSPSTLVAENAYDATVNLAKNTHPYAQSMRDNLWTNVTAGFQWSTDYKANVTDCTTFAVEAIYSAIAQAMEDVNWAYITLPSPVVTYDNVTHHLEIPEFDATFTNDTGTYNLNETIATIAEVWYVYYDYDSDTPDSLSSDNFDLSYNATSGKWYYADHLAPYTAANRNHSVIFYFDMDRAAPTWSNLSVEMIFVPFYNTSINWLDYHYDNVSRTLDIWNVSVTCWDIPEIGEVTIDEVSSLKWHLYTKGEGSLIADAAGIQVIDTEGNDVEGDLYQSGFIGSGGNFSSFENDVGLVFSAVNTELYVLVRVELIVPVGYIRYSDAGGDDIFIPFIQRNGVNTFRAKDHDITISEPELEVYTEEIAGITKTYINAYGITAISDYNNTVLNYYEIIEKEVHGSDRREARWKVFLFDGIPARLTGDLTWNETAQFWFVEGVEVGFLPDNRYYLAAKIVNMNTNFTTSPWGPQSEIFEIKRPLPVLYYILPEFFLAGFIVLFGWLAWYRPRKKRMKIQAEREARLEKIYD